MALTLGYPHWRCVSKPNPNWENYCEDCRAHAERLDRARATRRNETGHVEPPIHLSPAQVHKLLDQQAAAHRAVTRARNQLAEAQGANVDRRVFERLLTALEASLAQYELVLAPDIDAAILIRADTYSHRPRRSDYATHYCGKPTTRKRRAKVPPVGP